MGGPNKFKINDTIQELYKQPGDHNKGICDY